MSRAAVDLDALAAQIQVDLDENQPKGGERMSEEGKSGSDIYPSQPPSLIPIPSPNLPTVSFEEGVNGRIGKLTAEAVLRDYEATAAAITSMGGELTRTVKRCEEYMQTLQAMIKDVNGVADSYRAKGIDIHRQIEESAQMTEGIRRTANEMASKISNKLEI